jgi:hypothetical protein
MEELPTTSLELWFSMATITMWPRGGVVLWPRSGMQEQRQRIPTKK